MVKSTKKVSPNQLSMLDEIDKLEHWEKVRLVEIDGIHFYSVLDIFKFYGKSSNPTRAWQLAHEYLKKQGFSETNGLLDYQFEGNDGKKKKATPVATLEVFLRIAQITTFEHWEKVRRFMSQAAAEKLESAQVRKLRQDLELVKKVWGDNQEGITHIELELKLIESLQLIRNAETQAIENPNHGQLMNTEYRSLFGYDATGLKQITGIKNPRRDMGNQALTTLHYAEQTLVNLLNTVKHNGRKMKQEQAVEMYRMALATIRTMHDTISEQFGWHSITGKALLKADNNG